MGFSRFMELTVETKIQTINKCRPISYVRLRRSCRFVDQFCEKNRKHLSVSCPKDYVRLDYDPDDNSYGLIMNPGINVLKIPLTADNIPKINKALSGFLLAQFRLSRGHIKHYDSALRCLIKAAPELKVKFLECDGMTAEQIERVMSSRWKIGGISIDCQLEMRKILKMDYIRKMDPLHCYWNKNDDELTEQDIVQLARGKKHMKLCYPPLSELSNINTLKIIAQNWKSDGHFPIWFCMNWEIEENYMDADISGLYSEIMDHQETFYVGSFSKIFNEYTKPFTTQFHQREIYDIWIRMDDINWQFLKITRSGSEHYGNCASFNFETIESTTGFTKKITNVLHKIYNVCIIDESCLYDACQTGDLEKIKGIFINIITKL